MKRLALIAVTAVLLIIIISGVLVYQNLTPSPALESITVGHVPVESFALLYVAQQQGYFTENGLNVTISDYATGTVAVDALTSGVVDIAGSSEYVVAFNAVQNQNISIIASLGEAQIVDLIAKQARGISEPVDLKGKIVATAKSTVAEFDLGRFLAANGMTMQDITLVYYPPGQFADAIGNGTVDAVVSWQLYNEQVKMRLETGFVDWPLQVDEPFFSVLSCRNDWLSSHPETVHNLLVALAHAQDYVSSNPAETRQIIKARFNYTDAYISSVWSRNNCTLTLTQKLGSVMEHEAAWMINNGLTTQKTEPAIADSLTHPRLELLSPKQLHYLNFIF